MNTKQVMPYISIVTGVTIFAIYAFSGSASSISDNALIVTYMFLLPFGMGGLVKSILHNRKLTGIVKGLSDVLLKEGNELVKKLASSTDKKPE